MANAKRPRRATRRTRTAAAPHRRTAKKLTSADYRAKLVEFLRDVPDGDALLKRLDFGHQDSTDSGISFKIAHEAEFWRTRQRTRRAALYPFILTAQYGPA